MVVDLAWLDFKTKIVTVEKLRWVDRDAFYLLRYEDEGGAFETAILKNNNSDQLDFEMSYKNQSNKGLITKVNVASELPPFATPTFRTKRSKTSAITTVAPSAAVNIDYQLTSELYAQGGAVVTWGAEAGDWVEAMIYDKDSIIPEAYRPALCEAWPVVAAYVIGEWVRKDFHEINTYPLNAKITAGLYLRVVYHASALGSDRSVGVNYYLSKKL